MNLTKDAVDRTNVVNEQHESKIWKSIDEVPSHLSNLLHKLTKQQLDKIRRNLELKGISSLKKTDLVNELVKLIPTKLEATLHTFDHERLNLVKKIVEDGFIAANNFPLSKIESLLETGLIYPVNYNDQKVFTMPQEIIEGIEQLDHAKLEAIVERNNQWIRLMHGMLYYYGVIDSTSMFKKIKALANVHENDSQSLFTVIHRACEYYEYAHYNIDEFIDYRVTDPTKVKSEHSKRSNLDYFAFCKEELLTAGEPNVVPSTPEIKKLLSRLEAIQTLSTEQTVNITKQVIYMVNIDAQPAEIAAYLQDYIGKFPSIGFLQRVTNELVNVSHSTPMWSLKGHTHNQLTQRQEKPLNRMTDQQTHLNVAKIKTRKKIGRNEKCPCGSGKKYKKCCGY